MPLYEYRCLKCEKTFEVRQKFSDEPLSTHADCGGQVQRLLSAPGLQFKGSGFSITDYARSGGGAQSSTKSEAMPESKTDSKPAATPAPASSSKSD